MRHVELYRAQDILRDDPVLPVTIMIGEPLPEVPYANAVRLFAEQARVLADALEESLPGGTLDALLGELHARKASLLRVPAPRRAEGGDTNG